MFVHSCFFVCVFFHIYLNVFPLLLFMPFLFLSSFLIMNNFKVFIYMWTFSDLFYFCLSICNIISFPFIFLIGLLISFISIISVYLAFSIPIRFSVLHHPLCICVYLSIYIPPYIISLFYVLSFYLSVSLHLYLFSLFIRLFSTRYWHKPRLSLVLNG